MSVRYYLSPSKVALLLVAYVLSATVIAADSQPYSKSSKIGSHLQQVFFTGTLESAPAIVRRQQGELSVALVEAVLSTSGRAETLAGFDSLGLVPEFVSRDGRFATLKVSAASELQSLAQMSWVSSLRYAPPPIVRRGSVTSRAGVAMRSNPVAARYSVDGSGETVGILSDSFSVTSDVRDSTTTPALGEKGTLQGSKPQDSGDLPPRIHILNDASSGTDEGAAMAELVYDVAPGAALAFHNAGSSRAEFAEAINALCSDGVASIVVDDILFLTENSYQDDLPAIAAGGCVQRAIPYVSAVGNDGDQGHRFVFRDANPTVDEAGTQNTPTGNDLHNWSDSGTDSFMAIKLPANAKMFVVLNWNQPSASVRVDSGSQIDLDLYITSQPNVASMESGRAGFVASSRNPQGVTGSPSGDPIEWVELTTGSSEQTFYIAVEHYNGAQDVIPQASGVPVEFRLLYTGAEPTSVEYPYNFASSWGHALAPGIISVAAVPWWESPEFVPERYTTPSIDPEPFSSRGGTQLIQFAADGSYQPVTRFAPSLSAIDGVNNTFLGRDSGVPAENGEPDGFPNFFGTSAAAPNLAAVLAILKQTFPKATVAALQAALIDSAIDVTGMRAAAGVDDVSGAGLIDANGAAALLEERVGREGAPPPPDNPSSASGGGGSGGGGGGPCFIATAAYGSYLANEVVLLRKFRDQVLLKFALGREFVELYYRYSPPLADAIAERPSARALVRAGLTPMVVAIKYPFVTLVLAALLIGGWLFSRQRRPALETNT